MALDRRFRFGTGSYVTPGVAEFQDNARRVEAEGYDTFCNADHFNADMFPVGPALVAAACATTTLRLASFVYSNNFRHPALLARESATIDVSPGGRLEFGLGAAITSRSMTGPAWTCPTERPASTGSARRWPSSRACGPTSRSASTATTTRSPTWRAGRNQFSSRARRSTSVAGVSR